MVSTFTVTVRSCTYSARSALFISFTVHWAVTVMFSVTREKSRSQLSSAPSFSTTGAKAGSPLLTVWMVSPLTSCPPFRSKTTV